MAIGALAVAGSTLLSYLLNQYNSQNQKDEINASRDQAEKLSKQELTSTRRNFLEDILKSQSLTEKNIKQVGAAKRLPSGAIGTALTENRAVSDSSIARFEGDLQDKKLGNQNRINDQYTQSIFNFNNAQNLTNQAYLGNLSKVFMLWNAGYFNQNNNQGQVNTGNLPQFQQNLDFSNSIPQQKIGQF